MLGLLCPLFGFLPMDLVTTAPAPFCAILFREPPVVPMMPAASMRGFLSFNPVRVSESIMDSNVWYVLSFFYFYKFIS